MATQRQSSSKSGKNDVVQCDYCGEVYSSTYRHCPFCDETNSPPSRSSGSSSGSGSSHKSSSTSRGRRVARTTRGGGYGKPAYINQVIFFVTTLALIIAACFVISWTVGPLLNRDDVDDPDTSITTDVDEPDDSSADVDEPDVVIPEPDPVVSVTAITLSHADVTLSAGESFTITPTIFPADTDVSVVWSSSSGSATVSLSGLVTNTNTSGSSVAVTITATAGDVTAECIVRCKPISSTSTTTTTTTTGSAVISNASAGLNVRAGAGTTYDIIASLENGTQITVLDSSTSGWYQISFIDGDGDTTTGYVSSSYVTIN